ncbi:MAG: 2Fe-2S ferredoxin [Limisphaerales bacterium]|jgi:2Fe-2S ferredoxin
MGKVTFISTEKEAFEFEANPGISVMQIATANALPGVDAECGGSLSCATCHVYVDESWISLVGEPSATERTMLEFAEDPKPTSRLSCQIKYTEPLDGLVLHIPQSQ